MRYACLLLEITKYTLMSKIQRPRKITIVSEAVRCQHVHLKKIFLKFIWVVHGIVLQQVFVV